MKNRVMATAIAAAIVTPAMLLAADSSMSTAPAPMYLCHTSGSSETPNSMMGTTHLTCAPVDVVKMRIAVKNIRAMEDKMHPSTKAQVGALEKMTTYGQNETTGG